MTHYLSGKTGATGSGPANGIAVRGQTLTARVGNARIGVRERARVKGQGSRAKGDSTSGPPAWNHLMCAASRAITLKKLFTAKDAKDAKEPAARRARAGGSRPDPGPG